MPGTKNEGRSARGPLKTDRQYLLGTDDEELKRLQRQHEVWRADTGNLLRRAGFSRGQTLLDMGCGPGFATFDLARIAGEEGRVIGIDSSPEMIAALRREIARRGAANASAMLGDIESLDGTGEADGAFARWVLCFLKEPARAVRAAARRLKPGGKLAAMEYFHYRAAAIEPRSALFDMVSHAVFESFQQAGGNLEIGRKLPGLMQTAGLEIESIASISAAGRPGSEVWNWLADFLRSYLPKLVAKGLLRASELRDFENFWAEASRRSDAFVFAPPMVGVVGVKPRAHAAGPAEPVETAGI